jgi:prophage regulatory protein
MPTYVTGMERVRLNENPDDLALIRKKPLADLLSVSAPTLMRWVRQGRFPEPIRLSDQIVAWRRSDVADWIDERRA